MTAPATTARSTPGGTKLTDGYQTLIASAADPDVSFYEKTVQPMGLDGGEKVDNTTMHNTTYRTYQPASLIETGAINASVAYDPEVLDQIVALINVLTSWTVHHPDGSTWDFWGFLRSFTPDSNEIGTQPTAQIVIETGNVDTSGNEEGPVYTAAGTA